MRRPPRRRDRILDGLGTGGAVVCASDLLALGVMRSARNHGLEPGADLGVVGFDDTDVAEALQLTSVRQPLQRARRGGLDPAQRPRPRSRPAPWACSTDPPSHHPLDHHPCTADQRHQRTDHTQLEGTP